ncbi:MAG: DUF1475 family protein [Leptolyngbya sp.]|nr:DUF1475 family protein [Candidatus Melainabacteria bacterium]
MINVLKIVFAAIFLIMVSTVSIASLRENIFAIPSVVTSDPWFVATLVDAYVGFTIFYLWVCSKEKTLVSKVVWFFAIMLLGNIATSAYVLIALFKLRSSDSIRDLLVRN